MPLHKAYWSGSSAGFSLMEMIVAMTVISVLACLCLPALSKAMASARTTACASNLRQIYQAVQLYTTENNGGYPAAYDATTKISWQTLMINGGYISKGSKAWLCPEDYRLHKTQLSAAQTFPISYGLSGYVGPAGTHLTKITSPPQPSQTMLGADGIFNQGAGYWNAVIWSSDKWSTMLHRQGINVLYLDGHIECVSITSIPNTSIADGRQFWLGSPSFYTP